MVANAGGRLYEGGMSKQYSLLLLGAGNMGGALFNSWATSDVVDRGASAVVDPNPTDRVEKLCAENGIALNPEDDGNGYDLCVLAVKPQMFGSVLPGVSWPNIDKTLFLSIAAGVTIDEIRKLLKSATAEPKVVRTMPNLPSAVGQGMTLLCADRSVSDADREAATALFNAAGRTVWAADEDKLDRLMGISGCGPAYIFLLAEAMEEAALEQGANEEDARILAETTIAGAAAQLLADGRPAAVMREAVTSPGGTTAAALSVLDSPDGFRKLMHLAVEKAYLRAKELGQG
jgi:pyrroline-5-carboxylate reductase